MPIELKGLPLQWGHDQLIVEGSPAVRVSLPTKLASMGPRSVDRGRRLLMLIFSLAYARFNGATIS